MTKISVQMVFCLSVCEIYKVQVLKFYDVYFVFAAISSSLDPLFKKDQDILVLPLDLVKFDTHEKLAKDVIMHFGKVK